MDGLSKFVFGGLSSDAFGIIMREAPAEVTPARDITVLPIEGRDGDLLQDNGRYKNVHIPYKCAVLPDASSDLRKTAIEICAYLAMTPAYKRLENTYDPDHFRMARVYSEITVESIVEQAGIFTVNFDFKPQRFLKLGEHAVEFTESGVFCNPTLFPAKPIITVYGTGAGVVTVGDQTVTIKAIEDQIVLDCDLQQAYRQLGDGAPENMNGNIKAPVFPQLLAGENPVQWTGDIERVEIIPRWWTL